MQLPAQTPFVSVSTLELSRLRESEQLLTAIMRVIDRADDVDFVFSEVDWVEAGITKSRAQAMWAAKKIEYDDFKREMAERQDRSARRQQVLDMLTPEQLELIGVQK